MGIKYAEHFVSFLRMSTEQRRTAWVRSRVLQWGGIALAWVWLAWALMLLWPVAYSVGISPSNYVAPNITTLMDEMILCLVPLFVTIVFPRLLLPDESYWFGAEITRQSVLRDDTRLAVVAKEQPEPLVGAEIPLDASRFSALRFPSSHPVALIAGGVGALPLVAAAIFITYRWLHSPLNSFTALVTYVDLGSIYLLVIGMLCLMLVGAYHIIPVGWWTFLPGRRRKMLAVDDWGIRWREGRWRTREHALVWEDVSAFRVGGSLMGFSYQYAFVLLGEHESFAWMMPANKKLRQHAIGEELARLVVTRTQLPLLDVNKIIDYTKRMPFPFGVSSSRKPGKSSQYEKRSSELVRLLGDMHAQVRVEQGLADGYTEMERAVAPHPLRMLKLDRHIVWIDLALVILVVFGLCGLWQVDHRRSDAYDSTFPARIAAETPLFSDSLTAPSGNWPIHTPTIIDSVSKQYAYGGYAISGGTNNYPPEQVNTAMSYGDVAVAVTVRLIGASDYGGVGITLHVNDGSVVFFIVNPSRGSWWAVHYGPGQWHDLASGDNSDQNVVHTGANAVNRLLLVLRGNEYLLYINGEIVTHATDATPPPAGRLSYIGLYVEDNTTTGVFNDFAIYPAPPLYQPLLGGL